MNLHENHTIRFSVSENPSVEVSYSHLQKHRILYLLPKERSRMGVYFFFRADCIEPMVLEYLDRVHSNGN